MANRQGTSIFISYARKDGTQLARRLYQDLATVGFNMWLDTEEIAMTRFSNGLYLTVEAPTRRIDCVLNVLLPEICRDCFVGDLCERYETEILPALVAKFGSSGFFAARRWYRKQIICSIFHLLWYRFKTLVLTDAAWQPRGY